MNTSSIERSKQELLGIKFFFLCLGSGWDLINYSHNYLKVMDFPLTRKKENPENHQQQSMCSKAFLRRRVVIVHIL